MSTNPTHCIRCAGAVSAPTRDHCDECLGLLRAAIVSLRDFLSAQAALEERAKGAQRTAEAVAERPDARD